MENVRTAVVGFGGMGRQYVQMIHDGDVEGMTLAGVCCRNQKGQEEIGSLYPEVSIYPDVEAMFERRREYDAVVIVTPHATHVEIGKAAAAAGKHILVDKPAGVSAKEVRELIASSEAADVCFGMIFNTRMNPAYSKVKQMIKEGALGRVTRAVWVANTWFRTPAYHNSAAWRSTWAGEHGGLLINQSQHFLDVWQWLLGMPDSVLASIDYGKYNDFLVDDSMDIQFTYKNGLHGTFITASGENPGVNRLELWGTKGRLSVENNRRILFDENVMDIDEFRKVNTVPYGILEHRVKEIPVETDGFDGYQKIFQNFTDHIRKGTPLLASGEDGLRAVMMANGAYLSSWMERRVGYPVDDEEYVRLLEEKIKEERRWENER